MLIQFALSLGESPAPPAFTMLARYAREHLGVRWMDAALLSSLTGRGGEMLAALIREPGAATRLIGPLAQAVANALIHGVIAEHIAAQELARYGVTCNAISPGALTRMTENLGMGDTDEEGREMMSPRWIAPIATWLASTESAPVTGRVFQASGRGLGIANMWHQGPMVDAIDDPAVLGDVVRDLESKAQRNSDMNGRPATGPGRPNVW